MSQVLKLTDNVFEDNHVFKHGPLERRISVPGSAAVFKLNARREGTNGHYYILVTVTADDPGMEFKARITTIYFSLETEDVVTRVKNTSDALHDSSRYDFDSHMVIKVEFLNLNLLNMDCNQFIIVVGDLKSYVERGSQVTLVGIDGSTTVSKRLLKMRSEALEMIFSHDSQEKQTDTSN